MDIHWNAGGGPFNKSHNNNYVLSNINPNYTVCQPTYFDLEEPLPPLEAPPPLALAPPPAPLLLVVALLVLLPPPPLVLPGVLSFRVKME